MVFKAVHMNSRRQSKVQQFIQREITQPILLMQINEQILIILTFLSFLKKSSKVELYTKFFQKFWAQNKIFYEKSVFLDF